MYSSTLSLISALDGVGDQRQAPAALPRYTLYIRLGEHQGRSARVSKISPPLGFDPRTVQSLYRLRHPSPFYTNMINKKIGPLRSVGMLFVSCQVELYGAFIYQVSCCSTVELCGNRRPSDRLPNCFFLLLYCAF
jgi:hypothetical protein